MSTHNIGFCGERYFSYFSTKTYVVGTHQKPLDEALLMSTHNICFCGERYFYFSTKTCSWYSLEVPQQGASNEYPQHMFLWRKIFFLFLHKNICCWYSLEEPH